MRPRAALVGLSVALIVLIALGWLIFGARELAIDAARPVEASDLARAASPALPSNAANAPADATASPALERSAATTPESAPQPADAPADGGLEVQVLRHNTRDPVPGAQVTWWARPTSDDEADEPYRWFTESTLEENTAKGSKTFVADAEGKVRVPRGEKGFFVVASSPGWWGYSGFSEDPEPPLRVQIARDADLRVRVVDGADRPLAGVRVAARMGNSASHWHNDLVSALTGSEGLALLKHAGYAMNWNRGGDLQYSVAACALVEPAPELALDRDALPTEPMTIVLETGGSCEVRVVEWNGEPAKGKVDVRLRLKRDNEESDTAERWRWAYEWSGERAERVEGGAVFAPIELGRTLVATVSREGSSASHHAEGLGPRTSAERTVLTVRLGEEVAIAAGRLLDEKGQPLRDAKIRSRVETSDGNNTDNAWKLTTDADGRFQVDVTLAPEQEDERTLCVYTYGKNDEELACARKLLPARLSAGVNELGDFALRPSPLLASGRVVDGEGKPLANAAITPSVKQYQDEDRSNFWWNMVWQCRAVSAKDGSFEIRGNVEADELSLSAQKEGLRGDPVIVQRGATGVVVVLGQAGEIAGVLLTDPSVPLDAIQIHAQLVDPAPDSGEPEFWSPNAPEADGTFTLRSLRPGRYSLKLMQAGTWEEMQSFDDILVVAGETTRDPRLNPIDLRGTHRALAIELVDELGEALGDGLVLAKLATAAGDADYRYFNVQGGKARVVFEGQGLDLVVQSAGYLTTRLSNISTDQRVVMRRGPSLRFVLAAGLRPPQPPVSLGLRLERADGNGGFESWYSESPEFDARGEARCSATLLGDVRVALNVNIHDDRSWTASDYDDQVQRVIHVADRGGEQVFEISFDQAKLDEAAQQLRENH